MCMQIDKQHYDDYLDQQMEELWEMARYVHANPELCYEEHKACEVQCCYLREKGFQVQQGVEELDTAYIATFGQGFPHIAVIAEYDALPDLGHACGHNLICTTALGTAIETKKFMEDHKVEGTLYVIGTPAEESGGGKIRLLEKGVFQEIDTVFMMHPTSALTRLAGECMSSMRLDITFTGKSAHAGSHPEDGINALSAANLYFVATGLLRQQFKGDMRLSGVIIEGGTQPGLIPDHVRIKGSISSFDLQALRKNAEKVRHCAEGSAHSMGCKVDCIITEGYQGRVPNQLLSDLCKKEFKALQEPLLDGMPFDYGGEDLGNVSRIIPICNPYVTIFADHKISNHTPQFCELADSQAGYRCIQVGSKAMARTIMELFQHTEIIEQAKQELKERLQAE